MSDKEVKKPVKKRNVHVSVVQLEGLALIKIIRHCHQQGVGNTEVAQGVLLGLVVGDKLEITNCFPFPRYGLHVNEEEYQLDMMRHLRKTYIDHLSVGWYQSTQMSNFMTTQLIESQYCYQNSIDESVVLIYDPIKTSRGFLSVSAYRLTPEAMEVASKRKFTCDELRHNRLGFNNLFSQVKVVIKNSHLVNTLLCDIYQNQVLKGETDEQYLDMSTSSTLERHLVSLMEVMDELGQSATKFNVTQRQVAKQAVDRQMFMQQPPDTIRGIAATPKLVEEEAKARFPPMHPLTRIDALVSAGQVSSYANQITQFCGQMLAKQYTVGCLHNKNNESE